MLCREVQNYISTAKGLPFFYVVGDEDYSSVLVELKQVDISIVRMSDFCFKDDKFPSVDEMCIRDRLGTGAVLCMAEQFGAFDRDNLIVPIWMI